MSLEELANLPPIMQWVVLPLLAYGAYVVIGILIMMCSPLIWFLWSPFKEIACGLYQIYRAIVD